MRNSAASLDDSDRAVRQDKDATTCLTFSRFQRSLKTKNETTGCVLVNMSYIHVSTVLKFESGGSTVDTVANVNEYVPGPLLRNN